MRVGTEGTTSTTGRWLLMLAVAMPSPAWAQDRPWDWGHPMMWGWGWGMGMMLMMLVFWGLIIGGLVVLVRWLTGQGGAGGGGAGRADRALEILRERYARGEIDREEFESRKRDLL